MDGRDIGSVVLPNANPKIFLTASSEVRAKRRFDELTAKGETPDFDKIKADIEQRDYQDMHREISPLVKADDAHLIDTSDIFTDRDMEQEADLSEAEYITLEDGKDVTISTEGVYVIQGSASDASIIVEAEDTAKVQLVLDGVSISNSDFPCIYVKSADKVFVTLTGDNTLDVTGTFTADGETNTDAVIYSKDDLVFNGTGSLKITSTANGTCKDDLKVTGGNFNIDATEDAIEANDSVSISDGSFTIKAGKDGIHCENSDDTTVGSIYISGGSFDIEATDDGIQATTVLVIDGGSIDVTAAGSSSETSFEQFLKAQLLIEVTESGRVIDVKLQQLENEEQIVNN